ncbi:MAG: MBL fold metallo-hydrolase [Carnobacterium sp.]|uniref:MBL fold metallo-hydrolase n=1 Tax=Carnobacterium sp. TaxID=48221 RepID=UPI00331611EF
MTQIKKIVTGMIGENCYVIYQEGKALIVDPGDEFVKIKNILDELKVAPVAILLTHTHYDHIGALEEVRKTYSIPVYVSDLEQAWLGNPILNLSIHSGHPITAEPAETEFELMKIYDIEGFQFKVVPTPGHSPGGVSFIFADFVVSGDALFKGSIGRTDLTGSDSEALLKGIKEQLFSLSDDLRVYPGHGEETTIGYEKRTNPFFKED